MIAVDCPLCGKRLKVKDELAGRRGRCGGCRAVIDIPRAAAPAGVPGLSRAPTHLPAAADAGGEADLLELQTLLPTASGGPAGGPETLLPPGAAGAGPAVSPELYDFLAPPERPGEVGRLGPYRVLKVLGAGGMGVVFLAEDAQLKRQVALKAMLPALSSAPGNKDRFLREARAAASVSHDNVITIYQVGEDRGTVFLAMQLLQGETLEDRIRRRKRQPIPEVLRIGREIAAGLAAAHEKGLVHRDIKPGNVWLEGGQGRVKILDFGLARAARGESQLTQSGAIVGTPAYMAPEQARGGEVDARCDLFSLGCVLYRMCAGELPFKGNDTLSVLTALALETPPPVDEVNPDVPPALADLVTQLLEKDAGRRPKSARAVIEALTAIEGGKTGERRPRRAGERTVRLAGERVERGLRTMTAPRPVEEDDARRIETSARRGRSRIDDERRPRRRRRSSALGWVVVGVGVLGLTAVVLAVLLLGKKPPGTDGKSPGAGDPGSPGVFGLTNPGGGTAPAAPPRGVGNDVVPHPPLGQPPARFDAGERVYLSDLQEFDVGPGPPGWKYGKNGGMGNPFPERRITAGGQLSPKGLGMHPPGGQPSRVKYRISPAETFEARVGLDDSSPGSQGDLVFEVLGDGRSLWRSQPVREKGRFQECRVSVRGVQVLELRVHPPAGSVLPPFGGHAVWLDPYVTRSKK